MTTTPIQSWTTEQLSLRLEELRDAGEEYVMLREEEKRRQDECPHWTVDDGDACDRCKAITVAEALGNRSRCKLVKIVDGGPLEGIGTLARGAKYREGSFRREISDLDNLLSGGLLLAKGDPDAWTISATPFGVEVREQLRDPTPTWKP